VKGWSLGPLGVFDMLCASPLEGFADISTLSEGRRGRDQVVGRVAAGEVPLLVLPAMVTATPTATPCRASGVVGNHQQPSMSNLYVSNGSFYGPFHPLRGQR
jgi:hypothetical protein